MCSIPVKYGVCIYTWCFIDLYLRLKGGLVSHVQLGHKMYVFMLHVLFLWILHILYACLCYVFVFVVWCIFVKKILNIFKIKKKTRMFTMASMRAR